MLPRLDQQIDLKLAVMSASHQRARRRSSRMSLATRENRSCSWSHRHRQHRCLYFRCCRLRHRPFFNCRLHIASFLWQYSVAFIYCLPCFRHHCRYSFSLSPSSSSSFLSSSSPLLLIALMTSLLSPFFLFRVVCGLFVCLSACC